MTGDSCNDNSVPPDNEGRGESGGNDPRRRSSLLECLTKFPAACPHCRRETVMPVKASTVSSGGVIVDVRCRQCHHGWQCYLPGQGFPATRPKPDRRKRDDWRIDSL